MDVVFISNILHLEAEKLRLLSSPLADDVHEVAMQITHLPDLIPQVVKCEECDGPAIVHEFLCPSSVDYQYGYRMIRKCVQCGEMEIR